jgi:two-component system, chemotaxis family, CheB/CheR fusion protein
MLDKSETIAAAGQLFTQVEKKFKIYARKKEVPGKAVFEMTYRLPDVDRHETSGHVRKLPQKDSPHVNNNKKFWFSLEFRECRFHDY